MNGVVIPACVTGIDIQAIVDVDVVEVIDIDIDAATAPVEPAPERVGHTDAHTPCDAGRNRARPPVAGRRRIVIGGIGWIHPWPIDHSGVVGGHVNHRGLRRLDHNDLRRGRCRCDNDAGRCLRRGRRRLHRDIHLFVRLQVACLLCASSQALHRIHHILWLREEGVAKIAHIVGPVTQRNQGVRKGHQRSDRRIPGLVFDHLHGRVTLGVGMSLGPGHCLRKLVGIGRRHQDLGQERIGIQGDLRHHLVELLDGEGLVGGLGRHGEWQQQQRTKQMPEPQANFFDHVILLRISRSAAAMSGMKKRFYPMSKSRRTRELLRNSSRPYQESSFRFRERSRISCHERQAPANTPSRVPTG